jgi:two-component system nitrate/nitrite response regulator NarL
MNPWDDGAVAWSVLIVDDHAGFRSSARALLEADGFDVLGEAADGESAVEEARRLRPQVVLLDIQLPGMDGFAVAESLAAEPSAPAVVLVSSRGRGAYRGRLESAPTRGFITKSEFSGECLSSLLG